MRRTTEQWEALLDGTADGPWEVKRYDRELVASICTTVHDPKRYVGDIYGEWNARLVAHAPEAVAEVIRLRKAMESLRDSLAQPWQAQTDYERGLQAGYGYAAYTLTCIIEKENH